MIELISDIKKIISPLNGGDFLSLPDSYVKISDGQIEETGPMENAPERENTLQASGKIALPGFVDPHTHLIFAGSREEEFIRRSRGEDYDEGGINSSAQKVREASAKDLVENGEKYARTMLARGTTTIEVKSGYGLSKKGEIKMLEATKKLKERVPQDLIPTFLGAHSVPRDREKEDYVNEIISEMIPEVEKRGLAEYCDVFCDQGFFTLRDSEKILKAARAAGLKLKIHADEITRLGGAKLASKLKVTSADHLLKTTSSDLKELKEAGVIPVLLPGTAFTLNESYPPAEKMLENDLPMALGTDFNPGTCLINSLPLIVSISVMKMGISPESALAGITLNAAKALDRGEEIGSLEKGKKADLVLLDADNLNQLPYFLGHNLVDKVIKEGEIVYERNSSQSLR